MIEIDIDIGDGGMSSGDAEAELLRPFLDHLHRHQHSCIPPSLIQPLLSQLNSPDEETVTMAVKSLGYIIHKENIVTMFSVESSSMVLLSIVKLITSTDRKALCNLAVWCLGIQEFGMSQLETNMDAIIQAIVYAIDNPMGSKAITYEALQAIVKMMRKVPKMKMTASVWAPLIYKRLLAADKRDRDMAERCLKDVEPMLLPTHSSLAKVVAVDISQTLLPNMEKMVASRGLMIPTIRAWSWLVRLLGVQAGEKRHLLNRMLKVVETTFTSQDSQVQIASLVAWEALIDAFLPCSAIEDSIQSEIEGISAPSADAHHKPHTSCSIKRLKLLMTPLITIMNSKSHESVKLACWRTWIHLAHKLDCQINDMLVQDVAISPMFEVILRSGPDACTPWVWELCLNALYELIACKVPNSVPMNSPQHISIASEGQLASPKSSPISTYASEVESSRMIKWTPWHLDALESILKYVMILWKCGLENYKHKCDNLSLNGSLKILSLVIKCVEDDEKGVLKPSEQHVRSVHSLLMLFSKLSREAKLLLRTEHLVSVVWPVVEVLMNLGSLVLSSSFYKLLFEHPCKLSTVLDNQLHSPRNQINADELITPIVYIIGVWIQLGCNIFSVDGEEVKVLQKLEKIAIATKTDLGIMDNLRGVGNLLVQFLAMVSEHMQGPWTNERETTTKMFLPLQKHFFLLRVWKIFASHLENYLDSVNDIPTTHDGIDDSGFQVIDTFLLFPVQFSLYVYNLPYYDGLKCYGSSKGTQDLTSSQAVNEVEHAVSSWSTLFNCGSRISSLKSSKSNLFARGHCRSILKLIEAHWPNGAHTRNGDFTRFIFPDIIGAIVVHILKHLDISNLASFALNRKRRFGSFRSGVYLTNGLLANEVEDTSNIRDALCIISRFLDLAWNELPTQDKHWFNSTSRILAALASFSVQLNTQQDVLMYLQELSKTLAKWLSSPERICISQNTLSSDILMRALANVWEKLLSCIEKCRPPLNFDSNLLAIQASLLIPAFQHRETSIANITISFWEATYGTKASFLKYPPCLIPVLNQLKDEVNISLPGWDMQSNKVKGKPHVDMSSRCDMSSGRKQLRAYKEQMCMEGSILSPSTLEAEDKATKRLQTSSFIGSIKRVHADQPVDGLLQRIKRPLSNASHIHGSKDKVLKITDSFSELAKRRHVSELPSHEKVQYARTEYDSGTSVNRKKVRFSGDECVQYVSIPLTPKLPCPLTDHQKEVKRTQQSGGIGMKTYTYLDFSQSQVVLDSEDPEEIALDGYMKVDEKIEDPLTHNGLGSSKAENAYDEAPEEAKDLKIAREKSQNVTDGSMPKLHPTKLRSCDEDNEVQTRVGTENNAQKQRVLCRHISETEDVETIVSPATLSCDVELQNALDEWNNGDIPETSGDTQLLSMDEQTISTDHAYDLTICTTNMGDTQPCEMIAVIESNQQTNRRINAITEQLKDIKASVKWECLDLKTLDSLQTVLSEFQDKVISSIGMRQIESSK